MTTVEIFDFVEVELPASSASCRVTTPSGTGFSVPTFSQGGSVRARIMPLTAGVYRWEVEGASGEFEAIASSRKGILEADGWNFRWSGSKEPFFWTSTTAYMLAGLREDLALAAIDRLAAQGVNRIRVSLCPSRQPSGERWMEPQVTESDTFTFRYGPWVADNPTSVLEPQFDTSRFDEAYWAKFERLLARARDHDMVVQVIFFTDAQEDQNYPFDRDRLGDDPAERRYYEHAVARLGAFSNVEWCITNEWALFRPDQWVEAIGQFLAEIDPYHHPISVHGHGHFPFRASPWCSHALFQVWDEHGAYAWMREKRAQQLDAGQAKPQINDENGYQDHYPFPWGEARTAPARDDESRARLAWEIVMAGGWVTQGESAASGRGGWINGYEEGESPLFTRLRHLRDFFTSFDWWRTEPTDGIASGHTFCRAKPGICYAVYAFAGSSFALSLPDEGPWDVDAFNPRSGEWKSLRSNEILRRDPQSLGWVAPHQPYGEDWAYRVRRTSQ
ncbi:MAG: DUF4038 domain-containing protein [Fimbriimonas sp.]